MSHQNILTGDTEEGVSTESVTIIGVPLVVFALIIGFGAGYVYAASHGNKLAQSMGLIPTK